MNKANIPNAKAKSLGEVAIKLANLNSHSQLPRSLTFILTIVVVVVIKFDDYQKNRVNFVEDIKKSSKFSKQHAEQLLANLQRYSGNVELREVS